MSWRTYVVGDVLESEIYVVENSEYVVGYVVKHVLDLTTYLHVVENKHVVGNIKKGVS